MEAQAECYIWEWMVKLECLGKGFFVKVLVFIEKFHSGVIEQSTKRKKNFRKSSLCICLTQNGV
jgi:hypothetical protein